MIRAGVIRWMTEKGEGHDLEEGCVIERPKVVYCPKTGKFVMYFHLELKTDYDFLDNDVKEMFCRFVAGPADYTPGAMDNYRIGEYGGNNQNPGSLGTRSRQMAMMVMYDAPLQMLCDSPTKYEKNMESFLFMAKTPVWADVVLAEKLAGKGAVLIEGAKWCGRTA